MFTPVRGNELIANTSFICDCNAKKNCLICSRCGVANAWVKISPLNSLPSFAIVATQGVGTDLSSEAKVTPEYYNAPRQILKKSK